MIRTNLSTRPFYNEAAVRLWLTLIAFMVAAATVFNVQRLIHYSRSDTELAAAASRDEQRAVELRADGKRLRATVNASKVEAVSIDARTANELIDRRTFSWTELFNRFEATLPADVRITSLRHNASRDRGNVLTISVLARNVDDVNQFMENLGQTGVFSNLLAPEERMNADTGLLEVVLETVYRPVPSAASEVATGASRKPSR